MGIVSGGGGGTFNGGTITNPLVIDQSASGGNTVPLTIKASYNNQSQDFLEIINSDNAQPLLEYDSSAKLDLNNSSGVNAGVFTTNGTAILTTGTRTVRQPPGALSALTPVSGTAVQNPQLYDIFVVVPVTLNPTAGAAATCLVEMSPDNVTYTTLATVSIPAGVVFDGTVIPISLGLPYNFYFRLTAVNATIGTGHYW